MVQQPLEQFLESVRLVFGTPDLTHIASEEIEPTGGGGEGGKGEGGGDDEDDDDDDDCPDLLLDNSDDEEMDCIESSSCWDVNFMNEE